jgi:hypothetical protein
MSYFFAGTLFLSSCLLFLVEPLCAKMVLPTLGGTPSVWNTCMVFFQAGLLAGYAYAHFGPRLLGWKRHLVVHLAVLFLAFLSLPVLIAPPALPPVWPALWLLGTLVLAVGAPFLVVAACSPLYQRWFVHAAPTASPASRDPYFLYAAGNLGSFSALGLYPFVVEPLLTLRQQAWAWTVGYALFVTASLACALVSVRGGQRSEVRGQRSEVRGRDAAVTPGDGPAYVIGELTPRRSPLTPAVRLRWALLALVPSSLMLSVTSYLTTDIAPIPLLWVIPLGIYLLTFTLAFARTQPVSHQAMVRWMPLVVLVLAVMILQEGTEPLLAVTALHLVGLFWLAMVCHGELSRTRPSADHLTEFYLWLAVGGMLGGLFTALLAPLLFVGLVEYPLMIAAACLLRPSMEAMPLPAMPLPRAWAGPLAVGALTLGLVFVGRALNLEPGPVSVAFMFAVPLLLAYLMQTGAYRFGTSIALIFLAAAFYPGIHGPSRCLMRSFFGVHRVTERDGFRKLFHGNILHGQQSLDWRNRNEPLTYYHPTGPIGQVMTSLRGTDRLQRVGLIGLGTGALAAYAEPGRHWTFFEIDPAVVHIASPSAGLFTYLRDSPARIDVVVGDARLTLNRQPDQFGLLVVDAFGSDAIPLHLLTREALQIYLAHLQEDGILAFHVSNRYVNLEPVLANLSADHDPPLICKVQHDLNLSAAALAQGKKPSVWVLVARSANALGPLTRSTRWPAAQARPELGVWNDDFSNLVSVWRWQE